MNLQQRFLKMVLSLGLVLILAGVVQVPQSAWASMEDAAIFYDELKDHGEWVDYQNYGPVWYPTKVQENWRPYVDGRWSPSEQGHVFETQEPWGHATYHYGNWMPTPEYGWVWVPGRTWYPNTVTWRTSPESEGPDSSYIGWAPIPPPNYTPVQGYYPEGYYGGAPYQGSLESLITAPFWIFVRAASFLLGFSNPYTPAYSYWGSSALIPPPVVPYYYTRTVIVNNYYIPRYYPAGYIAAGLGYYNWGPHIPYVARVTRINQVNITNYIQQVNIYQRYNVVPPPAVLARRPYLRDVMPPAMLTHNPLPPGVRAHDIRVARANLVRPNLVNVNVIKNAPRIPADIPKVRMGGVEPGQWRHGIPGAALPASAMIRDNRQMEERMRKIPTSQRLEPVSPSARRWNVPQTPGAGPVQPVVEKRRRGPELTSTTPGAPITSPPPRAGHDRRGPQGTPQTVAPGQPGAPQETIKLQTKTPAPEGRIPGSPGPSQAVVPQERFKQGQRYPGSWGKHEQTPETVVTPGQYPRQRQMQPYTPGTAPAPTATPTQIRPQRPPWAQQPQQQQQAPFQPQPQMQRPPQPQPQPVQRQPQPQPFPQVQRQPQSQPQPQMHQQPRYQPQPQAQSRPQAPQKQQEKKQHQQQNQ